MLKRITLVAMVSLLGFLGACNTIGGIGRDMEAAGGAIKNTVDKD
jgi:predicted small secreted protein